MNMKVEITIAERRAPSLPRRSVKSLVPYEEMRTFTISFPIRIEIRTSLGFERSFMRSL